MGHLLKTELPELPAPNVVCQRRAGDGFTLIELLVAVAVVALIAVFGIPSFRTFVINNQIKAGTSDFAATLSFARSNAIARATTVIVCASSSGNTCPAGSAWADGWLVFVDANNNGQPDNGEELQVHGPLDSNYSLAEEASNAKISFSSLGGADQSTFTLCGPSGATKGSTVSVTTTGRTRADVQDLSDTDCDTP